MLSNIVAVQWKQIVLDF